MFEDKLNLVTIRISRIAGSNTFGHCPVKRRYDAEAIVKLVKGFLEDFQDITTPAGTAADYPGRQLFRMLKESQSLRISTSQPQYGTRSASTGNTLTTDTRVAWVEMKTSVS